MIWSYKLNVKIVLLSSWINKKNYMEDTKGFHNSNILHMVCKLIKYLYKTTWNNHHKFCAKSSYFLSKGFRSNTCLASYTAMTWLLIILFTHPWNLGLKLEKKVILNNWLINDNGIYMIIPALWAISWTKQIWMIVLLAILP